MDLLEESSLILRITEYALNRKTFSLLQLKEDLLLNNEDFQFISRTLTSKSMISDNPNQILVLVKRTEENIKRNAKYNSEIVRDDDFFSLLPTAFYNYVDYLEIKEARKHADEAKRQASLALNLTIYAIIISILFGMGQLLFQVIEMYYKR
jgi:hypothetical protein